MLAGHDDDDMFVCNKCKCTLLRDLFTLHVRDFSTLSKYRTYPMPRCSFKVQSGLGWHVICLDKRQAHLLEKHDLKARIHFADLLGQRGHDARTCEVVCPVCPSPVRFAKHEDFSEHFMQFHFQESVCYRHLDGSYAVDCDCRMPSYERLEYCRSVPNEVRQHRRATFRVWPAIECYSALWDKTICRGLN